MKPPRLTRRRGLVFAFVALSALAFPAVAFAPTFVYTGEITTSDPTQTGRVRRDLPVSACGSTQPVTLASSTSVHHYDAYSLHNSSAITQCVTVTVDAGTCVGTQFLQTQAYSPSFDPSNVAQNYVGDPGQSPNPVISYAFDVPAGTAFVVVVHETVENTGCPGYTVTVEGQGISQGPPTGVSVVALSAARAKTGVVVSWQGASQSQALGYNVFRAQAGERLRVNRKLIRATGTTGMHFYHWLDHAVQRHTARYWLQEVSLSGSRTWHGPAAVR